MGCGHVSNALLCYPEGTVSTYQVADHDLALAAQASALGGSGLGCAAGVLGILLDAASRGSRGGVGGTGGATLRAAAALLLVAPLAGEDLIERLVELAGHDGDERRESERVWF